MGKKGVSAGGGSVSNNLINATAKPRTPTLNGLTFQGRQSSEARAGRKRLNEYAILARVACREDRKEERNGDYLARRPQVQCGVGLTDMMIIY